MKNKKNFIIYLHPGHRDVDYKGCESEELVSYDLTLFYGRELGKYFMYCHGVSLYEQLEHVVKRRRESLGLEGLPMRRMGVLSRGEDMILGAPDIPAHLPEAEAILPGHTLIRPAFGMLKSALTFPHRDLEDGAGVYGNFNMLGLKYGGRIDRVLYTQFRRLLNDVKRDPNLVKELS